MDEDLKLIEAFKHGDQQAFTALVTKYSNKVFGRIYSIMDDANQADDIAQEVFLNVFYSLNSFRGKSSFSTWLYRITVNECLQALRKRKNKVFSIETALNENEHLKLQDILRSNEENAENKLLREERERLAMKLLKALPDRFRVVLTLRKMENLSYKDIAENMGISVNTVKVWLFRARMKLKELADSAQGIKGGN